jgi:hypothetical protein
MKVKQILTRVYVNDLDKAIGFYEKLTGEKCLSRFEYKEAGLEIATVKNILIIAGPAKSLEPFRHTTATFLVDSVEEFKMFLLENHATLIRDIKQVPTGLNMTMKHEDGCIVEYVEFK